MIGAFGPWRVQTTLSVLGIVAAAAYMLKVLQQVLLGPLKDKWRSLTDMTSWELLTVVPLLLIVLALGVYPLLMLHLQDAALTNLIAHVMGR